MDAIRQYLDQSDEEDERDSMECEDIKSKDIKIENIKTEDLKLQDIKIENIKLEDLKSDDIKAEDHKPQDIKIKDLKAEDLKEDENNESIKQLVDDLISEIEKPFEKANKIRRVIRNENEIQISSDEFETSDEPDTDTEHEQDLDKCLTRFKALKTKGELLIEDLPAPDDEPIQLTCGVEELQQIGNVNKILDNILIIESFKNLPALDLDSFLFFRNGRSIGKVFDVIGPVIKPFYVIRFATHQQILDNSIAINMPVYFVPKFDGLTKYVLVSQLKEVRGTDASWENNNEPPDSVKEYSDDEEERKDKLKVKAKRKPAASNHNFKFSANNDNNFNGRNYRNKKYDNNNNHQNYRNHNNQNYNRNNSSNNDNADSKSRFVKKPKIKIDL